MFYLLLLPVFMQNSEKRKWKFFLPNFVIDLSSFKSKACYLYFLTCVTFFICLNHFYFTCRVSNFRWKLNEIWFSVFTCTLFLCFHMYLFFLFSFHFLPPFSIPTFLYFLSSLFLFFFFLSTLLKIIKIKHISMFFCFFFLIG